MSNRVKVFIPSVEQLEDRTLLDAGFVQINAVPGDARFTSQWSLNNVGQTGGKVDADIDAPEAWNVTTGSTTTVVAVIDTGIDYRHLDLYRNIWLNQGEIPADIKARLLDVDADGLITFRDLNDARNQGAGKITDLNGNGRIDGGDVLKTIAQGGWADGVSNDGDAFVDDLIGWDFVNNDNNPLDDNDHGTHVAGIIGATGDDGVGVAGINWQVQLMAVKTIAATGFGVGSLSLAGLNYAVAHGASISNNSYGGDIYDQAMRDAIEAARLKDHVFIASAGNGGGDYVGDNIDLAPSYPVSYNLSNVVAVASTDSGDLKAVSSNFGAASVDLGAPGRQILSTTRNDGYKTFSGTSMAAAHVTGVFALLKSQYPTWKAYQLVDQVLATVDWKSSLNGKTVTGGRLNAFRALTEVRGDVLGADVVSAVPNATGAKPVSSVRLTFSEAMDPSSFTTADIELLSGPNGAIAVTSVTPVAGSSDRAFDVTFDQQTTAGTYTLRVGADVRDLAGNPLRQGASTSTFVIQPITTFTNATKVAIKDLAVSISTITVDRDIWIADLNVRIDILHTFNNDLYIHLRGPDGTDVDLSYRHGGKYDNYTNTLFDDEATIPIAQGAVPFTGSFIPDGMLSRFDGKLARGTWQLIVEDQQKGDVGSIKSWSLIIENAPAPTTTGTVQTQSESETVGVGIQSEETIDPARTEPSIPFPVVPASAPATDSAPSRQTPTSAPEARFVDMVFTRLRSSDLVWASADAVPRDEDLLDFFRRRSR